MKILKIVLIIVLLTFAAKIKAQNTIITRLRGELATANSDNSRFAILDSLNIYYLFCSDKIDSSYFYCNQSIQKAFPLADKRPLILAYARMGAYFFYAAKYGPAIQILNKAVKLSQQVNYDGYLSYVYLITSEVYSFLDEYNKAWPYLGKASHYLSRSSDRFYNVPAQTFIAYGWNNFSSGKWSSGSHYLDKANYALRIKTDLVSEDEYLESIVWSKIALRRYGEARQYCLKGLAAVKKNNDHQTLDYIHFLFAAILQNTNKLSEATTQGKLALAASRAVNDLYYDVQISKIISECYDKMGKTDSALYYLKANADYYAELNKAKNISDVEAAAFSEEMQARETQAQDLIEKEKDKDRLRLYVFVTGIGILLLVALMMWRHGIQRKKAYALLRQQKLEIESQKSKVETALTELKSTQSQLVQREKMASLGELTAGIAHEIQNPLNFVNNFSEVSVELLDEMDEELDKGDIHGAKIIGADLKQNLQKIQHHGKRADFIVKGMLEHSRTNTGEKQLTDMNVLCDEFLKLSFHGLRAKDKSFNAEMIPHFDHKLPKVNVSQQDMGRVMLNLFNNAFYAVLQKQKITGEEYKPEVSVTTYAENGHVVIKVKDNGIGIPNHIKDKIMQPFFTTKPTGEGTGLGLSLSYDMIVKGHGGTIAMDTKEGEFTEFIVALPVNNLS